MHSVIIGMGEIGKALHNVLIGEYNVVTYDVKDGPLLLKSEDIGPDVLHICIPFIDNFYTIVKEMIDRYSPGIVNIQTTVPPGTTASFGAIACHSTTRGLHPNLDKFIRVIPKHIGGPCSEQLAKYFGIAGIDCVTHNRPETTELAHILNNVEYGVLLMYADEMQRICRHYGVDYMQAVMAYKQTYNEGYAAMDHASKCRPLLMPPNGKIGGHCVTANAKMMSPIFEKAGIQADLFKLLSEK